MHTSLISSSQTGITALHVAAENGHVGLTDKLLAKNADTEAKDNDVRLLLSPCHVMIISSISSCPLRSPFLPSRLASPAATRRV
jgi:ankyrin repeat protein